MARKLFCEYGPICYRISVQKEIILRFLRDLWGQRVFAANRSPLPLEHMVKSHRSTLLRRLAGVDMTLQENKVKNLALAAPKISGVLIRPGETFSFWRLVGNCTAKKGYLEGLTISGGKPTSGVAGGLCQLANLIHWMVLHSPLTVTELHHHTDALFPDSGRRVPFGTGTSIFYSNVDYRFYNGTPHTFQLLLWLEAEELCGELRSDTPLPCRYRIEERDHHYALEGDGYYRNSEIWKRAISQADGSPVEECLVFQNHSKVLYDPALIPPGEIRDSLEKVGEPV